MSDFTHLDNKGHVKMVDVTGKEKTDRTAVAQCIILMSAKTLDKIISEEVSKGNVLETARIAGIMAAKKTSELIPMCHPLNITNAKIDFFPDKSKNSILIKSEVRLFDRTGVEMEALTAASVSALTIYDMCKSYDKGMKITDTCLLKKTGGKSGTYIR